MTGLLLVAMTICSVAAAVVVVTQHLGFAPVLSASMEPALHPGDLIVTRPEAASAVQVGQIVALPVPSDPDERYVHRVIAVSTRDGRPVVRTKGDANSAPETFSLRIDSPKVPVVVRAIPGVGRVSLVLENPITRLIVIAITIAAIVLAAWRLFAGLWPSGGQRRA